MKMRCYGLIVAFLAGVGVSCRSSPETVKAGDGQAVAAKIALQDDAPDGGFAEVFSYVRVDRARGIVEFDGWVPIDCHDPRTPDVWLEQIVCTPDTREHESLVVSRAKPSEVHAAMLLIGLEAGTPGSYRWDGERVVAVAPEGDAVIVEFLYEDDEGHEVRANPTDWVIDAGLERTLSDHVGDAAAFVFAGSRFVAYNGPEVYDADLAGTLIGLATFGGETIAFGEVISHEAMYQEPQWLANAKLVPAYGTPVRVQIRALGGDER